MARQGGGSVRASFTITNGEELQRMLKELPTRVAKKILRSAMRKAAKPVALAAKSKVRKNTGLTEDSIKVKAIKRSRRARVGVNVIVGAGDYIGPTFYASFLEYGFLRGKRGTPGRKFIGPFPFMRPAVQQEGQNAANIAEREILKGIEKEAKFGAAV